MIDKYILTVNDSLRTMLNQIDYISKHYNAIKELDKQEYAWYQRRTFALSFILMLRFSLMIHISLMFLY